MISSTRPQIHSASSLTKDELVEAQGWSVRSFSDLRPSLAKDLPNVQTEPEVFIYYPWSETLIHSPGENDFRRAMSSRNRHKISPEEQEKLRDISVFCIGLSAGFAVLHTMVMEGIGRRFLLNDMDSLSLTNLNRLAHRVEDIGKNKTQLAAQRLWEQDPFLDITLLPNKLTPAELASTIGDRDVSLVIEECDDFVSKVLVREIARRHRIPVFMGTSDRGTIDVERFDLEPDRPILHGLVQGWTSIDLERASKRERMNLALSVIGLEGLDPRTTASLLEYEHSVPSWPQLASDVVGGGAMLAMVIRKHVLGELQDSGRLRVDLEHMVHERSWQAPIKPAPTDLSPPEFRGVRPTRFPNEATDIVQYLAECGNLAPSGGNTQPWKFSREQNSLFLSMESAHTQSFLDTGFLAAMLALGGVTRNIMWAASACGMAVRLTTQFANLSVPIAQFELDGPNLDQLDKAALSLLFQRRTTRKVAQYGPLSPRSRTILEVADEEHQIRTYIVSEPSRLKRIGEILGEADRIRFLHEEARTAALNEICWSSKEVEQRRDGLALDSLELRPGDEAVLRLLRDSKALEYLSVRNLGSGLASLAQESFSNSSGVIMATVPAEPTPESLFHAGFLFERVWLEATRANIGIHPWTALPYMQRRLSELGSPGADNARALLEGLHEVFQVDEGRFAVMIARVLEDVSPPLCHSARRHFKLT